MKKLLFFFVLFSLTSCTNYYNVLLVEDTNLYNKKDSSNVVVTIPKETTVYIATKANKYKYHKIKWGSYNGWAYKPNYTFYSSYISGRRTTTNYSNSSSKSSYSTGTKSSGGSVNVKGYYRKNGTYVKPHTRSAPRRR